VEKGDAKKNACKGKEGEGGEKDGSFFLGRGRNRSVNRDGWGGRSSGREKGKARLSPRKAWGDADPSEKQAQVPGKTFETPGARGIFLGDLISWNCLEELSAGDFSRSSLMQSPGSPPLTKEEPPLEGEGFLKERRESPPRKGRLAGLETILSYVKVRLGRGRGRGESSAGRHAAD